MEEFHGHHKIGGGKKRVLLDWRENEKEEEEDGAFQQPNFVDVTRLQFQFYIYWKLNACIFSRCFYFFRAQQIGIEIYRKNI